MSWQIVKTDQTQHSAILQAPLTHLCPNIFNEFFYHDLWKGSLYIKKGVMLKKSQSCFYY